MPAIGLILIVNTTHTGADSCHHLVRNGLKEVAQYRYGKLRSEYLYGVSFVAIDTRDVYHADIHADITYIRSTLSVNKAIASTVPQAPIKSVGIAYGDGRNQAITL